MYFNIFMAVRRPSVELSVVACCRLRTQDGEGQCVIAEEKALNNNRTRYMLIANHHTLPTRAKLSESSLVIAGGVELKSIVPDTTTKCFFYSCCGPDSMWGTPTHVPLNRHEESGCCPREEDWTVVILDSNFVQKHMRRMMFPCLAPQEQTSCGYSDVSIFERSNTGTITLHSVQPSVESPSSGMRILQQGVENCVSRFKIQYPYKESGDIGPECAGGPIFDMDTLLLLGIHCRSPFRCDSSRDYCSGLSINYIISSLYCGGLDMDCSLVLTLAFLKDIVRKLNTVPPAVVLDRVSRSIECHASNQRRELECHQSTMTSTKKQEEIRKSFMYNFEILEFILTELQIIFYKSFNLASIPDGLSAMKLLTVLFSMFDGFERVTEMYAVFGPSTPMENGGRSIESHISLLCQRLLQVLKNNRQSSPVIKVASELLFTLLNFSYDQGAACCFLETPNIRMLATVAQSDATKSDVGTMQAFYTAYLKILEFSHQNDVARTRHEGDRTRQGVEERLMATEKEIARLRSDFEHDTDREKNLILQLKETKQQNEELRIKCDQQVLRLRGLEERCVQLEALLAEMNKGLACELTRQKKGADLQQELLQPKDEGACRAASSVPQLPIVTVASSGAAIFSQSLDNVVDENVFLALCKTSAVSHWKFVGRYLGICDAILDTLAIDGHPYGHREVFYNLLKEWKHEKGNAATYRNLITALEKEGLPEACKTVTFHVSNYHPFKS